MKPELFDRWIAVQVRSRSEQMVETLLQHKGYEAWMPSVPRTAVGHGSSRTEPLFPGYVFCRLTESSHGLIVATPGVLRFAGPGGRPEFLASMELAAIRTVVESGLPVSPMRMQSGSEVKVVAGPLKGCCGKLIEHSRRGLLLIEISLLQRAIAVTVETDWLQPLPGSKPPVVAGKSTGVSDAPLYGSAKPKRLGSRPSAALARENRGDVARWSTSSGVTLRRPA